MLGRRSPSPKISVYPSCRSPGAALRRAAALSVGAAALLTLLVLVAVPDWFEELWRPFHCPLSDDELALLRHTLAALTSALDAANVSYFMMSGTLLGSYRHHDRIPWDDDVDLIVSTADRERLHAAVASLRHEFQLLGDVADGYQWKFHASRPRPGARRIWIGDRRVLAPFVDVFFYGENATHVWNTCPWFADEVWPRAAVFPLRRRPFGWLRLPAPCDPAAALAVNFDVRRCQSRAFDHRRNLPLWWPLGRTVEVDCSSLEMLWPFVRRRRWTDSAGKRHVTETLWAPGGTQQLHEVTLLDQCSA